jgi:CelD/BcsL family acetyltransferase involved in cellulose biosynthesis
MSGVLISSRPFHPDRNFHLGWRRPLFYGVCDFPKGLVGADGSSRSACKTARCRRVCPRQTLAERESLREIADAKKRPRVAVE